MGYYKLYNGYKIVNFVRKYRMAQLMSQSELAAACGVSKNTISSIECQKSQPNVQLACIISYVLGVPFHHLFILDI